MKVRSLPILCSLATLALFIGACSNGAGEAPSAAPAVRVSVGSPPQRVSVSVPTLADDVRLNDPKPELKAARSGAEHLGHTVDKRLSATQASDKARLIEQVQVGDKVPPSGVTRAELRQQITSRPSASPEYQLKQRNYLARLREIPSGLSAEETDAQRAALKQSVLGE